ncbi:Deacetoxyvindoline 4-hydroxylase [Bertholletia excelsa]
MDIAGDYDRAGEVKAFDDTKAGVKGLVDAGVTKVPKIFIRPPDELIEELNNFPADLQVPTIDLSDMEKTQRRIEIVDEVRTASEDWGFFQVVNHGIPLSVSDEMIQGIRMFHEQDHEAKKVFYTRDRAKKVRYESNHDLYRSRAANWRDSLNFSMWVSEEIDPEEMPRVCRSAATEYIKQVTKLGSTIFELLSEALGLKRDHLTALELGKGRTCACQYYPPCPEPELTLGISKHTDPAFLTILLQDQVGGLQVLHGNQWVNVKPIPGALVANVGDLLQIISNDKFKSVYHRVVTNQVETRISVAFFFGGAYVPPKIYGPIKELLSEENPPRYREFLVSDMIANFTSISVDKPRLEFFKL